MVGEIGHDTSSSVCSWSNYTFLREATECIFGIEYLARYCSDLHSTYMTSSGGGCEFDGWDAKEYTTPLCVYVPEQAGDVASYHCPFCAR